MNFPDLCCCLNKLKQKQNCLEKSEIDFIKYIQANYDLEIENEYNQLTHSSEQELNTLKKEVRRNLKSLKSVKLMLAKENLDNLDIAELKTTMISIENNIQDVKVKIKSDLDNFVKNENQLSTELCIIEMKLLDLNKNIGDLTKSSGYSAKNIKDKNVYQEVHDFAMFLNISNGHEGGWSPDDHLIFTKIFKKHKHQSKVVELAHSSLPDISQEDINAHYEWYKKYLELRSKQKNAIEKWKQTKNPSDNKIEIQKPNEKKIVKHKTEDPEVKIRLQQWKVEKQQKIQETQKMLFNMDTKVKEKDKQKQIKYKDVKREIVRWKHNKRVKEKADQLEKEIITLQERERRNALANKLIREFQSQDSYFVKRRLSQLKSNVSVPVRNVERNVAPRDPERLLKPTQQWTSRITPEDNNEKFVNIFGGCVPLKYIPKLAVPDWRKKLF